MTASDWERLETIYLEAMELPQSDRKSFVQEKTKGLPELFDVLASMIDVQDGTADEFLSELQGRILTEAAESRAIPTGTRIGKYILEKQIGKGGMGTVYQAYRHTGDFEQRVAIKLLDAASLTEQTQASFVNEQQIMANLSHPNIATILDGGIYEGRYPYIVMEYIEGIPIDEYLKKQKAKKTEIVRMLREVTEIVQFAHQNLVLHLDLKPSNIIVDKEGHLKLLDFGIGQLIGDDGTAEDPSLKLSMRYAAPEQFRKGNLSTATDIFIMGVLAHVLLTGTFPFEEDDRGRESQNIDQGIDNELKAIICRALNRRSEDRYDSASQLVADFDRYLTSRPVSARKHNALERSTLYIRRNKIRVSAAVVVTLSLIATSIFSYIQAENARRERDYALSTKKFIVDLFSQSNPFENSEVDYREYSVLSFLGDKRSEVLDNEELEDQTRFELAKILYDTYNGLSLHKENLATSASLLSIAEKIESPAKIGLANYLRGRAFAHEYTFDSADKYFAKALDYKDQIEDEDAYFGADLRNQIALNFHFQGAFDTARYWYQKAINRIPTSNENPEHYTEYLIILSNYSNLLRSTGEFDSAILLADEVIRKKEKFYEDSLDLNIMSNYSDRALVYMETGEYERAEEDFRRSLSIGYDALDSGNFQLEIILGNYIILKILKQDYEEGLRLAQQHYDDLQEKYAPGAMNLIYAQLPLAQCYLGLKEWGRAEKNLSEGLTWLEKMNRPGFVLHGIYLLELTRAHIGQKQWGPAREYVQRAMDIFTSIYPEDHYRIAVTKVRQGRVLMESDMTEGRKMIEEALPILQKSSAKTAAFIEEAKAYLSQQSI